MHPYESPVLPKLRPFVGTANPDYDESASIPTNSYRPSRGVSKVQVASAIRFALVTEAKPHGPPSWKVDICPTVRPRNPQSGQLFSASLWSVPSAPTWRVRSLSVGLLFIREVAQ